MWLSDLVSKVRDKNAGRIHSVVLERDMSRFKDMVEGWICGGASVAAIFNTKGGFVSVHPSHSEAIAKARAHRGCGMDCRIKNVTIR